MENSCHRDVELTYTTQPDYIYISISPGRVYFQFISTVCPLYHEILLTLTNVEMALYKVSLVDNREPLSIWEDTREGKGVSGSKI